LDEVVRFGVGPRARRAAEDFAEEMASHATPARALFKVELGGWVALVSPTFERSHPVEVVGGVFWRRSSDRIEVALVEREECGGWSLPRARRAAGEAPLVAASRMFLDEAGTEPVIGRRLPSTVQRLEGRRGLASHWAARSRTGGPPGAHVHHTVAWFSPAAARTRLAHPDDVRVLAALGAAPPDACVLLVRHASAGDPDAWSGADPERPLDAAGREQAEALRAVLPVFGVTDVASVGRVRCVDTLAPLAADLGVPVNVEPALDEHVYPAAPERAVDLVREMAGSGRTWAACSQGAVIPPLVASLAHSDGLPLPSVKAKKGSVWALFFRSSRVVAADYYPSVM
jgi:phosphohistidine phosphatase SixA/ADP-ribose pyrophosphatase YjhB (NUDIX family)